MLVYLERLLFYAIVSIAVTIGFNEVSSDLPNLISGVEIVQGKLKEGMSLAVTLKAKNLGKGEITFTLITTPVTNTFKFTVVICLSIVCPCRYV